MTALRTSSILSLLMTLAFVAAIPLDFYQPRRYNISNKDLDYAYAGRCQSSGCDRNRVCKKPLGGAGFFRVNDFKNGVVKYLRGAKKCAKKCQNRVDVNGTSVCDSFNYIFNTTGTNCILYTGVPNRVLGGRPGSTRIDYTNQYCYTNVLWNCVSTCDVCPPGTGPFCGFECGDDPCYSCSCRGPGTAADDAANCPALSCAPV